MNSADARRAWRKARHDLRRATLHLASLQERPVSARAIRTAKEWIHACERGIAAYERLIECIDRLEALTPKPQPEPVVKLGLDIELTKPPPPPSPPPSPPPPSPPVEPVRVVLSTNQSAMNAISPSDFIRSFIAGNSLSIADAAAYAGVSVAELQEVMRCQRLLTPALAARLSVFGGTIDHWLTLQAKFNQARAALREVRD